MISAFKSFKKFSDGVGLVTTAGGLILIPFFGAAAAGMAAIPGATNADILISFWNPLMSDPVTGERGLSEGISRIFNGWLELGESAYEVGAAGVEAGFNGEPVMKAMKGSLDTKVIPLDTASPLADAA